MLQFPDSVRYSASVLNKSNHKKKQFSSVKFFSFLFIYFLSSQLPVILYHGDRNTRSTLRKKMLKLKKLGDNVFVLPVIITSYEIIMNDRKLLSHIKWKYLIVDEGQRIKNTHCRLIR